MQATFARWALRRPGLFWLLTMLLLLWLPHISSAATADDNESIDIILLNYHKIDYYDSPLSVTPPEFEQQMSYFKTYNFHVVSLDQVYDCLEKGEKLPSKPVVITFDDGYLDNYTYAYPILQKYKFPATIFVITDLVGKKGYINWTQAKEMSENGIAIESHTVKHRPLSTQDNDSVMKELTKSREIIEKKIGSSVKYVAYPEGYYNELIKRLVKEAGYRGGLTIRHGTANKDSDPYALERIPIFHTNATIRDFMRRIHYKANFAQTGWLP